MMTSIARTFTFEAAHMLPHVPAGHRCGRMHGHSWSATVEVSGYVGADGMIVDFDAIKDAWDASGCVGLDHSTLNGHKGLENPTCEVVAAWIFRKMSEKIDSGTTVVVSVEVRETVRGVAIVRR